MTKLIAHNYQLFAMAGVIPQVKRVAHGMGMERERRWRCVWGRREWVITYSGWSSAIAVGRWSMAAAQTGDHRPSTKHG